MLTENWVQLWDFVVVVVTQSCDWNDEFEYSVIRFMS